MDKFLEINIYWWTCFELFLISRLIHVHNVFNSLMVFFILGVHTMVSSTNKTDCHVVHVTKILSKVTKNSGEKKVEIEH
jgi:hypothetical protein